MDDNNTFNITEIKGISQEELSARNYRRVAIFLTILSVIAIELILYSWWKSYSYGWFVYLNAGVFTTLFIAGAVVTNIVASELYSKARD